MPQGFSSKIIPLDNYEQAIPYVEKLKDKSLVIFDVDLVVQQPEEQVFQARTLYQYEPLIKEMMTGLTHEEKDACFNAIVFMKKMELIDPRVVGIIKGLQKRRIKTIFHTGLCSGVVSGASMPRWRFNSLKKEGLDCSEAFDLKPTYFRTLSLHLNNYPLFDRGILYTNGLYSPHSKGAVLRHFLDQVMWTPKHVVMFEDRMDNLRSVSEALSKMKGVESFTGINYKGALAFPAKIPLRKIVEKQWLGIVEESKRLKIERGH